MGPFLWPGPGKGSDLEPNLASIGGKLDVDLFYLARISIAANVACHNWRCNKKILTVR